ncbi:MAG TPA: alpha/beta hydrolase [Polyangiaceae bacterium]|nr:alpha/beta hydrolase [Polyangiaceae bacterium]
MQATESATLRVRGFELHAERWRGGDRRHVLLLHGLGGNSVTWHGVAPLLAERSAATVLAFDLPGFGRSRTGGRRVDLDELSRVVQGVVTDAAPQGTRWVLAGNSLGALLALELACRAPELVSGVTVAGLAMPLAWGRTLSEAAAVATWVPPALPWLGRRLIARYTRRTGLPGVVDEPVRALFADPSRLDAVLRERLLAVSAYRFGWVPEAARAYEETTWSLGLALLRSSRAARWIREASVRVQVIHGDKDPIFGVPVWKRLERERPDWEHVLLPGVGHVPQLEAPEDVARALVRWLDTL